jgi:hypothetical protein
MCLCWSWTTPWGSWCFGWGERPAQVLPATFRVLFEELVARGEVEPAVLVALDRASDDEEVPPP